MATLTRSPEVLARKNTTCSQCSQPIAKGKDYVAKVDGCKKGWMHASCADEYIRARELADDVFEEHEVDAA